VVCHQFWSPGWAEPTSTLPAMIYAYAVSAYPDWHRQAWAAGFVLLTMVLLINITARSIVASGSSHKSR
jgi:phosphate transport system permease protein